MRFNGRHDAGTEPLSASLVNTIAPLMGPRMGDGGLSDTGLSPFIGELALNAVEQREVQEGRASVILPTGAAPNGLLRGQLLAATDELAAASLLPPVGSSHTASGGVQLVFRGFTLRYDAQWSSDVRATAAHIHAPNGTALMTLTLLPDAGGARGSASAIPLQTCSTQACYTDVHSADGGATWFLRTR